MSNLPAYFISSKIDAICKKIEHKQHICQVCETITHHSEVASYCLQCAIAVFEECISKHDRRHKNHAQIKVSANTISNVVCPEHDKYLEAFCIDCSRAVCGACSISTHDEHTLKDVGSSEDRTDELDQLFDDHIASAEKQLAKLATIQDDFNGHIDRIGDQLDRYHDDVIKQLKQQHRSLRAKLQQRRDKVNHNLDKSKALIQQGNDCVNTLKRQSASWRRPVPGIPAANLTDIQDRIEGIKPQLPLLDVSLKEPYRWAFVPSGIVSLGSIVEEGNQSSTSQCLMLDETTTQTKETMSDETTTKPHKIIAGTYNCDSRRNQS